MSVSSSKSGSRRDVSSRHGAGRRDAGWAWAFVAALLCLGALLLYRGFAGDDTFIYLQYARNIATGNGFSFNAGEPSYGTTGPLWVLLVSGAGGIAGGNFLLGAKLLGFLFSGLAVLAFHALGRRLLRDGFMAGVATFTFASDPWLLKWGGSGMETPLSVLLVLLAVLLHIRHRGQWGAPISALLLGLGTLVRPELVALFLILLFDMFFLARRGWRCSVAAILLYVIPLLPWFAYAHRAFGDVIAATVHAKSGFTSRPEILVRSVKIVGVSYGFAVLAAAVGAVATWRRLGDRAARWECFGEVRVLWAWVLALPLAYLVTKSYVASRYLLIATPLWQLLGYGGLQAMGLTRRTTRRLAVLLLFLSAVTSVAIQATVVYPRTRFNRGVDDNLIAVGVWLSRNTPADALVAVHEVGAIGYHAERRILDTAGLVSPEALPYVVAGRTRDLLLDMRPDYYVSSGDPRTDISVFEPFVDRLTKLYEVQVQRGGSSRFFAKPMPVGVYRFDWSDLPDRQAGDPP